MLNTSISVDGVADVLYVADCIAESVVYPNGIADSSVTVRGFTIKLFKRRTQSTLISQDIQFMLRKKSAKLNLHLSGNSVPKLLVRRDVQTRSQTPFQSTWITHPRYPRHHVARDVTRTLTTVATEDWLKTQTNDLSTPELVNDRPIGYHIAYG
jgi:hypothetical protein